MYIYFVIGVVGMALVMYRQCTDRYHLHTVYGITFAQILLTRANVLNLDFVQLNYLNISVKLLSLIR